MGVQARMIPIAGSNSPHSRGSVSCSKICASDTVVSEMMRSILKTLALKVKRLAENDKAVAETAHPMPIVKVIVRAILTRSFNFFKDQI